MNLFDAHYLEYHPLAVILEYLLLENSKDIDDFARLVSVLISLSHVPLATFIFHEEWTISTIPLTCPLEQFLCPNCFSFVFTKVK